MVLSVSYVRYRDVRPIWDVVLQMTFYASGIFIMIIDLKPVSIFGTDVNISHILLANPFAAILEQARHVFIDPSYPSAAQAIGGTALLHDPDRDHARDDRARLLHLHQAGAAGGRAPVSARPAAARGARRSGHVRVAFVGQSVYFEHCALQAPAGGLEPSFVDFRAGAPAEPMLARAARAAPGRGARVPPRDRAAGAVRRPGRRADRLPHRAAAAHRRGRAPRPARDGCGGWNRWIRGTSTA